MSEQDFRRKFKGSAEVLQSLFENGHHSISEQFLRWKLWMKWREIMGAGIADNSEPVGYQRGTLYLWVKSAAWMQQMHFMKQQMKDVIAKKFHPTFVRDIRFTLDRREVPNFNDEEFKSQVSKFVPTSEDE